MEISYADFKSQVASYLQPDNVESCGSPETWDALQIQAVEHLQKALP